MKSKCYAKINLSLDSLYKREDNYHEIDTIMTRINLYDEIIIDRNNKNEFIYECDDDFINDYKDNLIYKVRDLMKEMKNDNGVNIKLIKNIPIEAGLGGGSTDAAEMIKALNELWRLHLTKSEMKEIALKLGADIPFFFEEKAARAKGIGEILLPFVNNLKMKILLINDGTKISSVSIYNELKDYGNIDNEKIVNGLIKGDRKVIDKFSNVMEDVIFQKFPHLERIRDELLINGAENALVSGSGGSIFGIFLDDELFEKAYRSLRDKYKFVQKVELIDE